MNLDILGKDQQQVRTCQNHYWLGCKIYTEQGMITGAREGKYIPSCKRTPVLANDFSTRRRSDYITDQRSSRLHYLITWKTKTMNSKAAAHPIRKKIKFSIRGARVCKGSPSPVVQAIRNVWKRKDLRWKAENWQFLPSMAPTGADASISQISGVFHWQWCRK